MTEPKSPPKGVTAIVHWPDGDVLATASDFDKSGYGGYSLFEAQRMRAKSFAKAEAIRKICHDDVVACLEQYDVDQLFSKLVRRKGYSLTVVPVGHEEEIERERERRK